MICLHFEIFRIQYPKMWQLGVFTAIDFVVRWLLLKLSHLTVTLLQKFLVILLLSNFLLYSVPWNCFLYHFEFCCGILCNANVCIMCVMEVACIWADNIAKATHKLKYLGHTLRWLIVCTQDHIGWGLRNIGLSVLLDNIANKMHGHEFSFNQLTWISLYNVVESESKLIAIFR